MIFFLKKKILHIFKLIFVQENGDIIESRDEDSEDEEYNEEHQYDANAHMKEFEAIFNNENHEKTYKCEHCEFTSKIESDVKKHILRQCHLSGLETGPKQNCINFYCKLSYIPQ